ncbi:four-helix bundle copper-binding protein [Pseudomonas proteolytica]|nr:four-helix bundle copper-binding protein [Pseudomonas proteolytica]TWR75969.1 four-helix bundle copper-binding protein [Pseudomonas proteolytica]
MTHCLEAGGKHLEAEHFRLMINCAEICQTSANFLLNGSTFHHHVCGVCAEICDACVKSCEQVGGMEDCVRACRECAEICRKMAGEQS